MRARSRPSAPGRRSRRGPTSAPPTRSSSATGWCGWRPRSRWRRSSTCRSGTTRPSSSPRCPTRVARRGGADGRQLPRPRPLPVHPPRHVRRSRRHRGAGRTRSSATAWRSRATTSTRRSGSPTRWAAPTFEVAPRRSTWWYVAPFADPPADRLPGRRRRADDPVLPPARRRHDHEAVLLRPAQRHRRRPHARSRTRSRSRSRSPRRTGRCSSASSPRPCRSTSRPRCTPAPTASRSRCAGCCSTSSRGRRPRRDRRSLTLAAARATRTCLAAAGRPSGRRCVALWIVGGRAGWASGMVVTPAEAVEPIVGDTRDLYVRATRATVWSARRPVARRAVRRPRRHDASADDHGAAADLDGALDDDAPRHPLDRGGRAAGRRDRGDVAAAVAHRRHRAGAAPAHAPWRCSGARRSTRSPTTSPCSMHDGHAVTG